MYYTCTLCHVHVLCISKHMRYVHIVLRMYVQPCVQVHVHVRCACKYVQVHVHVKYMHVTCVQVHVHAHISGTRCETERVCCLAHIKYHLCSP